MKSKALLSMVSVLGLAGGLASPPVARAQPGIASVQQLRFENRQRNAAELALAEREAAKLTLQTQALRRNLEQALKNRTAAQKERDYANMKLERALKEFRYAGQVEPVDKELLDSAQKEATYWKSRVQILEGELASQEQQAQVAEAAWNKALLEPVPSKVILPGEVLKLMVVGLSISISISDEQTFDGLYQVRNGGYIILPRVGRVSVAGKDLAGAKHIIHESLHQFQLRELTIFLELLPGVYHHGPKAR